MLPAGNGTTFPAWSDHLFQCLAKLHVISTKADVGRDMTCIGPGMSRQELGGFDLQQAIGTAQLLRRLSLHEHGKAVGGSGQNRCLVRRKRGHVGEAMSASVHGLSQARLQSFRRLSLLE